MGVGNTADPLKKISTNMTDKEKQNLIDDLVAALNGDAYQEAKEITEKIKATNDKELISKADYINSVL